MNDKIKFDDSNFGLVSAYVMQDDVLFSFFTPREALTFAANLKLASLSLEDRIKRVDDLIDQLGLKNCQNTVVGSIF
jgi:ABC-type multidrug transport system ATPase subunit